MHAGEYLYAAEEYHLYNRFTDRDVHTECFSNWSPSRCSANHFNQCCPIRLVHSPSDSSLGAGGPGSFPGLLGADDTVTVAIQSALPANFHYHFKN